MLIQVYKITVVSIWPNIVGSVIHKLISVGKSVIHGIIIIMDYLSELFRINCHLMEFIF